MSNKIMMQRQPTRWSCLATSFAMLYGLGVKDLIARVGHDGSEVINDLPDPNCRRGFYPEEFFYSGLLVGYATVSLETVTQVMDAKGNVLSFRNNHSEWLKKFPAVFTGSTKTGKRHAVCWCPIQGLVIDPNGTRYDMSFFNIENLYVRVQWKK